MKKILVLLVALFVIGIPSSVQADTCVDDLVNLGTGVCIKGGPTLPPLPLVGPTPKPPTATHNSPPSTGNNSGGGTSSGGNSGGSQSNPAPVKKKPVVKKTTAPKPKVTKKPKPKKTKSPSPRRTTVTDRQPSAKPAVGKAVSTSILIGYALLILLGIVSTYVLLFFPRHKRS